MSAVEHARAAVIGVGVAVTPGGRSGRLSVTTAWWSAGTEPIDALRLEEGYRVWSSDITPEETPYEAGLGFVVKPDNLGGFIRRDALMARRAAGATKRLRCLGLDDPRAVCLGNAPLRAGGAVDVDVFDAWIGGCVEREPVGDPAGERIRA